jgi:uracil-DNA glycosylase
MILDNFWCLFNKKIFTIPSSHGLFNQYKDRNPYVDLINAADIRRQNLYNYFKSFSKKPVVVLIGEAPGPWGCRFSGIPFTGERQLLLKELPFYGKQSSKNKAEIRVRKSTPYVSNSARIFWSVMKKYHPQFFVWNCVPIQPYKKNNILSVRTPTTKEVMNYSNLLSEILSILNPKHIVAVGKKAEFSLSQLGISCTYVRHPSQGGATKFKKGIAKVFRNV